MQLSLITTTPKNEELFYGTIKECNNVLQGVSTRHYDIKPLPTQVKDIKPQELDPVCRVMFERRLR